MEFALVILFLDASDGYWQIEVGNAGCDKTAIASHRETYGFAQSPLGLPNALSTFQREISVILLPLKWLYAIVNHEGIFVPFRFSSGHIAKVRKVLLLVINVGIT